ncbi:MAG: class I SAM-dependent methyltransferase [Candidatus Kerfeldbacteria bacterium]|nr:class I SAM-dependent methyltransferase [Candidatus Kerfeldbacteria bacterium]
MATTNRQKFATGNVVVQRLINRFHHQISNLVAELQPQNILEVGCGEGFLLDVLHRRLPEVPILGLDNSQDALSDGHRLFPDLPLEFGDIYHLVQPDRSWDVVVASEVLEHLDRPNEALAELHRVAQRYVVLSVPWEPWFQLGSLARGKHLQRWGNHPEHLNRWNPVTFRRLVSQRLVVERMSTQSSFPWMIVVARV